MTRRDRRTVVRLSGHEQAAAVDDASFRAAFGLHPSGVAVVTADPGDGPVALTVSSLASISSAPPMLTFSVSDLASSKPAFDRADTVVVHMLGSDQQWLAGLGSTHGADRFADTSLWTRLPTGEPVFPGVYAWLRGRVVQRVEAGNAVVCVVLIVEASVLEAPVVDDPPSPLVYHSRTWHRLSEESRISGLSSAR